MIAVIGSWHNAFVTAACLAGWGHKTLLVNESTHAYWDDFPKFEGVHEPGLEALIETGRNRRLLEYANIDTFAIEGAYTVWLALDTPLRDGAPDVRPLHTVLSRAVRPNTKLIVVGSQVPLGFCRNLEGSVVCPVAYVPENMRIGDGVHGFKHPERLIVGATDEETRGIVRELFPSEWHPSMITYCNLQTAEMIKHATNAFLATSISFANELARLGAPFEVDSAAVTAALKADGRIGRRAYVRAGQGFGGGTLERDLHALRQLGIDAHIPTRLVDAVLSVNDDAPKPQPTLHELYLKKGST